MTLSWIYKIVSPSGKIYIGQTINMKRRIWSYSRLKCQNQVVLLRSFMKYGFENHSISVLFSGACDADMLNTLEIEFIEIFNSFKKGLNQTKGGSGSTGRIVSQKFRDEVSKRRSGTKATEETKLKMSLNRKGKKKPQGFGAKVSIKLKSVKKSESHIKNMSLALKGNIPFNRKKVIDNTTGITYSCAKELSDQLNIKYSTLRGYLNSINNIRFSYVSSENLNNSKGKKVIDLSTGAEYKNIKNAADTLNINYQTLRSMLRGSLKNKTSLCIV